MGPVVPSTSTHRSDALHPFRAHVPDSELDDLAARLARTRPAPEPAGADSDSVPMPAATMAGLVAHWRDEFDWRAVEARLNAHEQYLTTIDGATVHVLHARSPEPDAVPLVLTHGWPGSVLEWLDVIGPLSDPRAHGLDPAIAFDVVVPSIPGFGFSSPVPDTGWGPGRIAAAGNDGGSFVSPAIAVAAPQRVLGVHVTQAWAPPPEDDPGAVDRLDTADRAAHEAFARYQSEQSAYALVAAQAPQTLAHALHDSPVGLLGWNVQAMPDLDVGARIALAALLWLTGTGGSALRIYQAAARETGPPAPTSVPVGVAQLPGDLPSVRSFAERVHPDLRSWSVFDRGGHRSAVQPYSTAQARLLRTRAPHPPRSRTLRESGREGRELRSRRA